MKNKKHIFLKTILVVSIFVVLLIAIFFAAFFYLYSKLPDISLIFSYNPPLPTQIMSSDGVLLTSIYLQRRYPIKYSELPKNLIWALVEAEDESFFKHSGFDVLGIIRATYKDIITLSYRQGASTITQQLARNAFLTQKKTFVRKIQEVLLAVKIERHLSKQEILQRYFNLIYFGEGSYGVKAASLRFFNKDLDQLNLMEMSILIAAIRNPYYYSPYYNFENCYGRAKFILQKMLRKGIITDAEYKEAVSKRDYVKIEVIKSFKNYENKKFAPYFIDYVERILVKKLNLKWEDILEKGYIVHTTLNYKWQKMAENALKSSKYQGGIVVLDAKDSSIKVMVGGRDYSKSQFNRITQSLRPPGSAIKPIYYTYAVASGFEMNDLLPNIPVQIKDNGKLWIPRNFENEYTDFIPMQEALIHSVNIASINLFRELTPDRVVDFLKKFGFTTKFEPNYSLALGSHGVIPIELANAYTVLANGGWHNSYYAIKNIVNSKGEIIYEHKPSISDNIFGSASLGMEITSIMNNTLCEVVRRGTGWRAYIKNRKVAGKTGTSNQSRDNWFIGYTPDYVGLVFIGNDDYSPIATNATGGRTAAPIWKKFMEPIIESEENESFLLSQNVEKVLISTDTGLLPFNSHGYYNKYWYSLFIDGKEFKMYKTSNIVYSYIRKKNLPLMKSYYLNTVITNNFLYSVENIFDSSIGVDENEPFLFK